MAMPARCAGALVVVPSVVGGKEARIAERVEKAATKNTEPKMRGFLRPTRSARRVMKLCKQYSLDGEFLLIGKGMDVQEDRDGADAAVDSLQKESLSRAQSQGFVHRGTVVVDH